MLSYGAEPSPKVAAALRRETRSWEEEGQLDRCQLNLVFVQAYYRQELVVLGGGHFAQFVRDGRRDIERDG
jgi:hypothetical protein